MSAQPSLGGPGAPYAVGDRVRVRISDRNEYANGAAEVLDGLAGTVEDVVPLNYLGFRRCAPFLVRFDAHDRKSWWRDGSKPLAFWFPAEDLEKLGEP